MFVTNGVVLVVLGFGIIQREVVLLCYEERGVQRPHNNGVESLCKKHKTFKTSLTWFAATMWCIVTTHLSIASVAMTASADSL